MLNSVSIFAIIVTYKGQQWYDRCFSSLRDSSIPVQTIVIDNASNDGTVEYIRENFPEIHLIESKENLGFGRANNLGMRYALDNGCDYVFLLNQDAWVEPKTIGELVRIAEKNPEYGLLSPMHINAEKDHLNILLDDSKHNYELLSDLYFKTPKDVYPITYANAAAWLLSRKTLETIGGFCPMFFYCGEDDDYMNRLKFHKIQMGICPSLTIVHDSKYRLKDSARLASKAAREGLYEILNINIKNEPINLLCYYLRKWILNLLRGDNNARKYCAEKIKFIGSNLRNLKDIRSKHRTRSTHWL